MNACSLKEVACRLIKAYVLVFTTLVREQRNFFLLVTLRKNVGEKM